MDQLQNYYAAFREAERTYNVLELRDFMIAYADIPFYAIAIYVFMIFPVRDWMKDRAPLNLKPLFILWNLILATFSILGAVRLAPYLYGVLTEKGLKYTLCEESINWWNVGPNGFWMGLFAVSKIPELFDTVFLVFQKKPIIFLHWYHHITVMLYCWFGYITLNTIGIWFGTMNYGVHAIMYSYYFMMSLSGFTRAIVKPFAKLITVLQIVQMIAGLVLIVIVLSYDRTTCPGSRAVTDRSGFVMYFSYFILFAKFFLDAYVFGKKGKKTDAAKKTQ